MFRHIFEKRRNKKENQEKKGREWKLKKEGAKWIIKKTHDTIYKRGRIENGKKKRKEKKLLYGSYMERYWNVDDENIKIQHT